MSSFRIWDEHEYLPTPSSMSRTSSPEDWSRAGQSGSPDARKEQAASRRQESVFIGIDRRRGSCRVRRASHLAINSDQFPCRGIRDFQSRDTIQLERVRFSDLLPCAQALVPERRERDVGCSTSCNQRMGCGRPIEYGKKNALGAPGEEHT